ncbi:MAG: 1-acyl-sn-glycerol-3-phosphate acyltransferase [candidate division Zixibacteria bacterium]|nr:1-acyl-sn-glycerol-3-phosphate acyltransferase [candidate division Zixibacteria bacterium]
MPEEIRQLKRKSTNYTYWFAHALIAIYIRTLCRLKRTGHEKIPKQGGLIIASNHQAAADPFIMGTAVPRELAFMAKKELFEIPIEGWLIKRFNAFPVDRFGFDLGVIKKSIEILESGQALVMFPEGTRSKDGKIHEGKIGVGMLARKAGVPIMPVYIENSRKAWLNLITGKRFIVRFGEIISADWIMAQENSKEGFKTITDEVMRRIIELSCKKD